MRKLIVAALFALAACRGEPVPRDYQNAPPDVGNAPQTKSDAPVGEPAPQPSTGVEGQATTPEGGTTATTLSDTPPTTTT